MANISYTAAGKKNSKKNPAIMNVNLHLDCGEVVSLVLEYTKKYGWMPSENTSSRAVYLYCVYVAHDRAWNDESLQNYINGYYNIKFPRIKESAQLRWFETYGMWSNSLGMNEKVLVWTEAK